MTDSLPTTITRHRPAALQLPDDPSAAAAMALAVIRGESMFDRAKAVEGLSARVAKLSDAGSDESLEELAAQAVVLNELFVRYSIESMAPGLTANKSALVRMALAAQTSYGRTIALIAGLKLQREGKAQVSLEDVRDDS